MKDQPLLIATTATTAGSARQATVRTARQAAAAVQQAGSAHPAGSAHHADPAATRRRTLPHQLAYWHAAVVIGLCLFGSVVPSPLYHLYATLWHFSPVTLTLIYATYAFGVLAALLLTGRVSDQIGRRPVLLAALGTLMVSWVLFIVASSTAWLFVARGVQGLATGAALSAASAALLDLHVRRDPVSVGLANAVASCAGLGLGSLTSAVWVQAGIFPRTVPYVMLLVLFAIALAGAYWMPEPVLSRERFRLTPQRPSVPAGIRHPFLLAGLAVLGSWGIAGLFFSIGAELSAHLFSTTNVIVAGLGGILLTLVAALAQLVFHRVVPWLGASVGSAALAVGMVTIVIATAEDSSVLFVAGASVAGAGFGVSFLSGLRQLTSVIPAEHRASVMSAFYVVAYASLSVPAVIAGLVVTHLGLATTFETFGSLAALVALAMAAEAWRTRPTRPIRAAK
ncbi:MAG TPA: MFS transporter [Streptosporangiaceae bacterium]|jgi:MFS family permease